MLDFIKRGEWESGQMLRGPNHQFTEKTCHCDDGHVKEMLTIWLKLRVCASISQAVVASTSSCVGAKLSPDAARNKIVGNLACRYFFDVFVVTLEGNSHHSWYLEVSSFFLFPPFPSIVSSQGTKQLAQS